MTDIVALVRIIVLLLLIALVVILLTRRLAVPYTLGLVVVGLVISFFVDLPEAHLTPQLVLFVFLPALLFEGSWSLSVQRLRQQWRTVLLLAGPGLLLSLLIIAVPLHFLVGLGWGTALLLSAILSPTDPIAVLGLFRQLKVNADLATIVEGESLFNDAVAGVFYQVFLVLVLVSPHSQPASGLALWLQGGQIFLLQAVGGAVLGGICGFLVSHFVKTLDDALIETTITLVTAYGVSLLADFLHTSSILAVIVAALLLGSYGRRFHMSERTLEAVDAFWSIIAFLANALLFLLVGIQLNPIAFLTSSEGPTLLVTAGIAIVAVLLARFVMVLLLPPINIPALRTSFFPWRLVVFWSGLRGALSLAFVLALPLDLADRNMLVFSTYAVVLFTLLVQGLSIRSVVKRLPAVSLHEKTT